MDQTEPRYSSEPHGRARRSREWLTVLPLVALVAWVAWSVAASGPGEPEPQDHQVQAEVAPPAPGIPLANDTNLAVGGPGDTTPSGEAEAAAGIAAATDPAWIEATAASAGIPARMLAAYTGAAAALREEQPGCHLGWTTLAGIGLVESGHATLGGTTALPDGTTSQPILGPQLDGSSFEQITDTDNGRWDGDESWDRAVGPMQFIPSTWETWGADGNADGIADPNQVDDAVLTTARYLCHSGDLSTGAGWQAAVYSYNHSDSYVAKVLAAATSFADS